MLRNRALLLLVWALFVSSTVMGSLSQRHPKHQKEDEPRSKTAVNLYMRAYSLPKEHALTNSMLQDCCQTNRTAQTGWQEVPTLISVRESFDSLFTKKGEAISEKPIQKPNGLEYSYHGMYYYLLRTCSLLSVEPSQRDAVFPHCEPNSAEIAAAAIWRKLCDTKYSNAIAQLVAKTYPAKTPVDEVSSLFCAELQALFTSGGITYDSDGWFDEKNSSAPLLILSKVHAYMYTKDQGLRVIQNKECERYRLVAVPYVEAAYQKPQLRLLVRTAWDNDKEAPFMRLRFHSIAGWGAKNDKAFRGGASVDIVASEILQPDAYKYAKYPLAYIYIREDYLMSSRSTIKFLQTQISSGREYALQRALWYGVVGVGAGALITAASYGLFRQPVLRR